METYIAKYGNFSHILQIFIDDQVFEPERTQILHTLHKLLHDVEITKTIMGTPVPIKWRTADDTDLFHYYTDGHNGMFNDEGIRRHSSMLLKDIREAVGRDKVSILITKPLTKKVVLM
jgi:hypothetical protein